MQSKIVLQANDATTRLLMNANLGITGGLRHSPKVGFTQLFFHNENFSAKKQRVNSLKTVPYCAVCRRVFYM